MVNRISIEEGKLKSHEIQIALDVINIQYSDIFLMDNWEQDKALTYLTGAYFIEEISDGSEINILVRTLDCYSYDSKEFEYITDAFVSKYNRLQTIWESGLHPSLNPPSYYIEWAISKRIDITWLNDAVEQGFYVPKSNSKAKHLAEKPLSTRTENNYLRLILTLANNIKGFNPKKPYEVLISVQKCTRSLRDLRVEVHHP